MREDDQLFLQINDSSEPEDSRNGMMRCDPDVLCSVLRGMTYQLGSEDSYCVVRRSGGTVVIECQFGGTRHECRMTPDEFSRMVAPVMPARLRAMLL